MEKADAQVSRGRGRPRSFDETVALDVAMRVFWEHGYDGASIADLTTAMGITPQSLYTAFGSKRALFDRALGRYRETSGSGFQEAMALPHAADAMIAALHHAADQFARRGYPHGCMISSGSLRSSEENAEIADQVAGLRHVQRQRAERRLRAGVTAGDLRADTDVPALARFVSAMTQGLSIQARDGASRAALHGIVDQAAATINAARA